MNTSGDHHYCSGIFEKKLSKLWSRIRKLLGEASRWEKLCCLFVWWFSHLSLALLF